MLVPSMDRCWPWAEWGIQGAGEKWSRAGALCSLFVFSVSVVAVVESGTQAGNVWFCLVWVCMTEMLSDPAYSGYEPEVGHQDARSFLGLHVWIQHFVAMRTAVTLKYCPCNDALPCSAGLL